jgi:hypothetical protein
MKNQEKFKRLNTSQKLEKLFKLLPIFSFFLGSLLFIFLIPAPPPVEKNTSSMSMSSSGYALHAANFKLDMSFTSLAWLVPAACYILLFFLFRYYFVISHIYPKTIPISSGIRAPPFQARQTR